MIDHALIQNLRKLSVHLNLNDIRQVIVLGCAMKECQLLQELSITVILKFIVCIYSFVDYDVNYLQELSRSSKKSSPQTVYVYHMTILNIGTISVFASSEAFLAT